MAAGRFITASDGQKGQNMTDHPMYHKGMRQLQDRFDTRRLADRLEQVFVRTTFAESDRAFIEHSSMLFLATADDEDRPEYSYKGGMPDFVRVVDEQTLAFPNYDGSGMYRSLGNIVVNPHVGLLFIDFEQARRLRVNGRATVHVDDPLLSEYPGAESIVRVQAERIFPNCPRYIHKMALVEYSVYAPREGHTPPVPAWKKREDIRDVLPPRDQGNVQPDG
jgi:predicted pyridoxine 5'-phosphate oxidase superfamily flavin-nucleotide-binding protein